MGFNSVRSGRIEEELILSLVHLRERMSVGCIGFFGLSFVGDGGFFRAGRFEIRTGFKVFLLPSSSNTPTRRSEE